MADAAVKATPQPVISTFTAAFISIFFTLLYVVPFYISKATRPAPGLNRDAPAVIRARVQTVTAACVVASIGTSYLLMMTARTKPLEALRFLGWWPIDIVEILKASTVTGLLYIGPLFEKVFVEGELNDFKGGDKVVQSLSSWQGYRNYVAGPITEEVIFRSVLIPIHILAGVSAGRIVLLTPLYFGIAHVHHFYEFQLTHPRNPVLPGIIRSAFQFAYTTLFGWYASFLYVRTGSLYACILVHAFCNWVGLPRFWGRVRSREQYPTSPIIMRGKGWTDMVAPQGKGPIVAINWTYAYYVLLLTGVVAFCVGLRPLTESHQALALL